LHVLNPPDPANGVKSVTLTKLWEAKGDAEDYFFGVITQIACDEQGRAYVLDRQLNDVKIFSPNGEFIRSIGREGEGPGEFRRPSDLFITPDGNVGVMQGMPGKIILLTPEGEPLDCLPVPEPANGGVQMFASGRLAGDHIVLARQQFFRRGASMDVEASLVGVDKTGKLTATYLNMKNSQGYAKMAFNEKELGIMTLVWDASSNGRVYISEDFDAYNVHVYNPDGTINRIVESEYKHRDRSAEEMKEFAPRVVLRRNDRTVTPEVQVSKTDRDIMQIYPRSDGGFWILSSRGAFNNGSGEMGTFDCFDPDGKFLSRVTLKGDGNYRLDGFYIVRNRLYVVKGLRSARRAMFGLGENQQSEEEEAEPVSVICYDLSPVVNNIE
jgi:hypothetical protein